MLIAEKCEEVERKVIAGSPLQQNREEVWEAKGVV